MLKDCSPINIEELAKAKFKGKSVKSVNACIDWLKDLSKNVKANEFLFGLSDNNSKLAPEPIVYTDAHGEWWVGRYIGILSFKGYQVEIQPRFGIKFVANQLPISKFAQVDIEAERLSGKGPFHFLQVLMWVNLLGVAAKHGLPVIKSKYVHESTSVRGRIDVRKTVGLRSRGQDLVASVQERKVLLNPVSVCIAIAFRQIQSWYPKLNFHRSLPEVLMLRLQQIIDAVPRNQPLPLERDLKSVRYSSVTSKYKPLVELSLQIIKGRNFDFNKREGSSSKGMLLDVAELWELYVLKVLENVFENTEKAVEHGTKGTSDYLLTSQRNDVRHMGKLIPDYLIYENNKVSLIADAKYKKLGDAPWMSPKRDDLYQMAAYITNYSQGSQSNNLLIYPKWDKSDRGVVASEASPWLFKNGNKLSFVTIPCKLDDAVKTLSRVSTLFHT